MANPTVICCILLMQRVMRAFSFPRSKAGSKRLARIDMMAMTTSNSISEKPNLSRRFGASMKSLLLLIFTQSRLQLIYEVIGRARTRPAQYVQSIPPPNAAPITSRTTPNTREDVDGLISSG